MHVKLAVAFQGRFAPGYCRLNGGAKLFGRNEQRRRCSTQAEEHKMPPLSSKLERKLRAAEESSDDSENYEVTDRSSSESVLEFGAGEVVDTDSEDGDANGPEDEEMVSIPINGSHLALTNHRLMRLKTTKYRHK
jgi:hypothetical protein